VLGRDKNPQIPPPPAEEQPTAGKGRPTPSRKEAEAANKRPLVPADRKVAAKDARSAARVQRDREYQAMVAGDTKNMPLQHRGPVRAYIRDWVDARRSMGQYFLPIVFVLLFAAMILTGPLSKLGTSGSAAVLGLYAVPYLYMFASLVESYLIWRTLRARLTAKFGADAARARGTAMYAFARIYQFRRLRMPKPQVKVGQYPS
jgi:hypothetical protein